jgi:hypothetical protein
MDVALLFNAVVNFRLMPLPHALHLHLGNSHLILRVELIQNYTM